MLSDLEKNQGRALVYGFWIATITTQPEAHEMERRLPLFAGSQETESLSEPALHP